MTAGRLLAWAPALLYMALIWVLSSLSLAPSLLDDFPLRDKGAHAIEYAVLGLLIAHATRRSWPERAAWRTAALALLLTILWGLVDEIHQAFVPGRGADVLDLAADSIGALFGVGARAAVALAGRGKPERAKPIAELESART
ncbi:MAG: VanZ family protein [Sandaracinaceae bacterium]|nr:VanZ family protein [Sandaracinaceae bacterium]